MRGFKDSAKYVFLWKDKDVIVEQSCAAFFLICEFIFLRIIFTVYILILKNKQVQPIIMRIINRFNENRTKKGHQEITALPMSILSLIFLNFVLCTYIFQFCFKQLL